MQRAVSQVLPTSWVFPKLSVRLLLGVGFAVASFAGWVALGIWNYDSTKPIPEADAAVVLGAALREGQPSPVFAARIDHGIALFHARKVRFIVFTGGVGSGQHLSEAESAARYASERGVPRERMLLETHSRTTPENLCFAHAIGTKRGLSSYVLVSDPLHMKRAMTIAQSIGMRAYASSTPTTMFRSLSTRLGSLARETFFLMSYRARWQICT